MRREGAVEVRPHMTEADKKTMQEKPLLRLSSTYITKGGEVLPRAGVRG